MRRPIEPAEAALVALVAVGLTSSGVCTRRGLRTLSSVAAEHRLLTGYLAAHLLGVLPRRFDPLSRVADRLTRMEQP